MAANEGIWQTAETLTAVYADLRALAQQFLSKQRPDHTLELTTLCVACLGSVFKWNL